LIVKASSRLSTSLDVSEDKAQFLLQRDQEGVRHYLIVLADETMPLNPDLYNKSHAVVLELLTAFVVLNSYKRLKYLKQMLSVVHKAGSANSSFFFSIFSNSF
jgi:hypothetical protein